MNVEFYVYQKGEKSVMSKNVIILVVTSVLATFFAAVLYAGTTVQDTFNMVSKEYKERKYHPAPLSHKKHVEEYKITCGECHHNEKAEPLNDIKTGDNVQRCIECHKIPSQKPKKTKLKGAKKREYHAEAMHDNCKGCHKEFNKKVKKETGKKGKAPTSCNKCHVGGKIK